MESLEFGGKFLGTKHSPNRIRLQRAATSTSWSDLAPQSDSVTSSAPRGLASRRVRPHLPDPDVPPLRAPEGADAVTVRGRDATRRGSIITAYRLAPTPSARGRRHVPWPLSPDPAPPRVLPARLERAGVAYVRGSERSVCARIQQPNIL